MHSNTADLWALKDGETKTPIWVDCDTGHDDAFALLLAAHCPKLNLLGVSTVHGNSSLVNTTRNTLSVLEAIGRRDVDVYAGAPKPFCRAAAYAPDIHGESGLDGTSLLPDPIKCAANAEGGAAVIAIHHALSRTPPRTAWLVSTGALTNIAMLFNLFPALVDHIAGLSVMGGAIGQFFTHAPIGRFTVHPKLASDLHRKFPNGLEQEASWRSETLLQHFQDLGVIYNEQRQDGEQLTGLLDAARRSFGNTTDYAEFNIYCDPEAAASVFSNPQLATKTTLIPLDITHQVLGDETVLRLLSRNHTGNGRLADSPIRQLFLEIMTFFAHTYDREFGMSDGPPLHDPIAIAAAFAPEMFDDNHGERFEVCVIKTGDECLFDNERRVTDIGQCGRTVAKMVASGQAGVRIPRTLDIPEFWNLIDLALCAAERTSDLTF